MASIIQVNGKWRATVRVKKDGGLLLNRSKSFLKKIDAEKWARSVDGAVDRHGVGYAVSQIKKLRLPANFGYQA